MKPHIVNCYPCKGASPADDYVGMHMSNEECPACKNATIEKLQKALEWYASDEFARVVKNYYFGETKMEDIGNPARTALQSIQGGNTHET